MTEGSRSSEFDENNGEPRARVVQFLLPSVGDIIFVALLGLLTLTPLSVKLLGDAGIGWHIRTGQQILATHSIPRVDSFSSSMSGRPWFAWEWLYDLAVGQIERVAGLNGVVLLTALIIAIVFSWTFRLLMQRGVNVLLAVALVLLAASASMIHFLARPHVVSWLLTLIWFWILDASERECFRPAAGTRYRKFLWCLPLVMVVWVNLHGGFLIAFPLLLIYLIAATWRWWASRDSDLEELLQKLRASRRTRDLALIGVFAALATLVNPYGWQLHAHIYRYLTNRFLMNHIDEFQSPNFHGVAERCFAVLLLIALVALAARPKALRLSNVLIVLFAVYSGLYASRNIPVASILLVLIAGPLLADVFRSRASTSTPVRAFLQRMSEVESSLTGHLWPIAAVIVACIIAVQGGYVGSRRVMNARFDDHRFPVAAVNYLTGAYLKDKHLPDPILGPDFWGGYFIYRLYPDTHVVLDDRHDLYGEQFFKSYLKMMRGEPDWDGFIRQYPAQCVLVPRASALANMLLQGGHWRPVFTDDVAIVFVPRA